MKPGNLCAVGLMLGCLLSADPAWARDRDVPAALRPYMSAEEFHAAGLHKLNPAELAQFQAWFVRAMRAEGRDPLVRAPEARPDTPATRGEDLAMERRRLAEERRRLEAEREELGRARERLAETPAGERARDPEIMPADDPRMFGLPGSSGINRLDSRIVGEFYGWDGPTRFTLENGQVWETIGSRRWRPRRPMQSPGVIIRKGLFDNYQIQVDGYNTRVDVRRVE